MPGPNAVPLPSGGIAAVPPTRPRRLPALLLAAAVALAGCSEDERAARERPGAPSTTVDDVRCPDGEPLPDGDPVAVVPAPAVQDRGPDGRDGALDIGTLLPRSGELEFLGAATLAGVELAVGDLEAAGGVLDAPIGLRHGDSAEGTPEVAGAEVARLLDGGADVIIGPVASGTASRVLEQVSVAGALLVSPGSTSGGLDALDRAGRFFRTGPTEELQGAALAELVRHDGHRTVALAVRSDDYGRAVADALAARVDEQGGSVLERVEYDPTSTALDQRVVARLDTTADALVLVGLAETAVILDGLVEVGQGPRDRPVYGTDGNLGERLGDLVADRSALACLRGLLPVDTPRAGFADRVRAHDPALAGLDGAGLDLAAESYDATVIVALAVAAAGSDDTGAAAASMATVTAGGSPCTTPDACLALAREGADLAYAGVSGPAVLDGDGNRSVARLTVVTFDPEGHLARVGTRRTGG